MLSFLRILCLASIASMVLGRLEPIDFKLDIPVEPSKTHKSLLELSANDPFMGLISKSGYIPVGKKGGKMFYWYIPSDQSGQEPVDTSKPVTVWLTGGPGCSSSLASFTENGPFTVQPDGSIIKNPFSWHLQSDMIYIDQPLGTGYSKVGDPCNYATDEHTVAEDLLMFLVKLIDILPVIKHRPFYVTGESYAGHYIPAIAHKLMVYPIEGIDFVGIAIGNGWVDPIIQYPAYATYAYEHHLIGKVGYQLASKALEECVDLIKKQQLVLATIQCGAVEASIIGKKNVYDIRLDCEIPPSCYNSTGITLFMNRPDVQSKFQVHKTWIECDPKVYTFLLGDWDAELRTKVADLVHHGYKVLVYSGDMDYICNWRGGEAWTHQVAWSKQEQFVKQDYQLWKIDGKPAGDYKHVDNFAFLKVYNAGHMVPMDQPLSASTMIKEFLYSDKLHVPKAEKTYMKAITA